MGKMASYAKEIFLFVMNGTCTCGRTERQEYYWAFMSQRPRFVSAIWHSTIISTFSLLFNRIKGSAVQRVGAVGVGWRRVGGKLTGSG